MSGNKVKGLLKGLRYISQIFENDKEQEIQIGYPTDVKHVAHIGWDGPSVNSPSWMNEFKSSPGFASPEVQNIGHNNGVKWAEGVRDLPELPKAPRRGVTDSPSREKSEKTRQSRKSSNKNSQLKESSDISMDSFSPARTPPDIPKKSRRKKSKENSTGGSSSKLRPKVQSSDPNVDSMPKSKDKQRSFEENE